MSPLPFSDNSPGRHSHQDKGEEKREIEQHIVHIPPGSPVDRLRPDIEDYRYEC